MSLGRARSSSTSGRPAGARLASTSVSIASVITNPVAPVHEITRSAVSSWLAEACSEPPMPRRVLCASRSAAFSRFCWR